MFSYWFGFGGSLSNDRKFYLSLNMRNWLVEGLQNQCIKTRILKADFFPLPIQINDVASIYISTPAKEIKDQ